MQNGENYYKMEVYKNSSIKTRNKSWLRYLRPNIWWFMVFCLVFIFAVLAISNERTSVASSYPSYPIVAIDAGHGGIDRGASGFKLYESDLNLAVSQKLESALYGLGLETVMTRTGDYGLYGSTESGFKKRDMQARKAIVEESEAGLLVSIHMNASTITDRTGVVIYCDFDNEESLLLANSVASGFESATVKDGDFYITTKIDTPAIIVECGFITTKSEAENLATSEFQQDIANSIARGILIYQRSLGKALK